MWKLTKTILVFIISVVIWNLMLLAGSDAGILSFLDSLSGASIPIFAFLPPLIISIFYFRKKETKNIIKDKLKEEVKTLSEKYEILETYKALAFLLMIVATGFYIYALVMFLDLPEIQMETVQQSFISSTVAFIITIFSLFCLTKIIDFLFDLDRKK